MMSTNKTDSNSVNSELSKAKRSAMLILLICIWLFSVYLYYSGELSEILANCLITLATLVLIGYSAFFFSLKPKVSLEKEADSGRYLIVSEVIKSFAFVLIIAFNFVFALSIQNHGGSNIASALLCLSLVLWAIPLWKYRFSAALTIFFIAYLIAEIGFY